MIEASSSPLIEREVDPIGQTVGLHYNRHAAITADRRPRTPKAHPTNLDVVIQFLKLGMALVKVIIRIWPRQPLQFHAY